MATTLTNTLIAEDWTKVYQTFKNADFQSYDFETLRKSMVDYLQLHYPEDFNDFIESSEYIALIDLIAFLGQSLAFRTDLNARENFLDTAERRDSILKLARLISYTPSRAMPASGLLKINSVSTTQTIIDSTGVNITNIPILWNDVTNDNWLEQISLIFNAAVITSESIGKPGNSKVINGVTCSEYTLNLNATALPVFPFSASINGNQLQFEAISVSSAGKPMLYEVHPRPTNLFNILYRNDNNGNSSINTGFFLYFKQGSLATTAFSLTESLANRVVSINVPNINDTDVWVYQLAADGTVQTEWTEVQAVAGINIVYNNLTERNIFQVVSQPNDQINLVFGDGSFSNIPQGNFVVYYRVGATTGYRITPDEMQNIQIQFNYVSSLGRIEQLTASASLQYTVANAVERESIESIRQRAPQMYYTQNRMITGEDYNLFPYSNFSNILKVKSVNRTSSGISRYLDVADVTGKYSSTNLFADDGILYKNQFVKSFTFTFNSFVDIYKTIYNNLITILQSQELLHFYYDTYTRYAIADCLWHMSGTLTNGATGYFVNSSSNIWQLGYVTSTNAKYIRVGSIVKFTAPSGYYFNNQNDLILGTPIYANDRTYLYVTIMQVVGDGTNGGTGNFDDGSGPVTINVKVPTGAIVSDVIPVLLNDLTSVQISSLITTYVSSYQNFGLAYNPLSQQWDTIAPGNLDMTSPFSLTHFGNVSNTHIDSSWSIAFNFTGSEYVVSYRGTDYVFESVKQVQFYFDNQIRVFDSSTGLTIVDQITIQNTNTKPDSTSPFDSPISWYVHKNITETDGYSLTNKILLTYPDTNNDGIPDNPDLFDIAVDPQTNPTNKLVFYKTTTNSDSFISSTPVNSDEIITRFTSLANIQQAVFQYNIGQLFYILTTDTFYQLTMVLTERTVSVVTNYTAYYGRDKFTFQYRHNSPNYRRIDPSPNNIVDMYVLTQEYNDSYQVWVQDTGGVMVEPTPPSDEDLELAFASLQQFKPVSDVIILTSAVFKPLFGAKADTALQATFKVVKNASIIVSDTQVRSLMITEINNYFNINLRDFGETFYFSDLSAYLHSVMAPMISSVVIVPKSVTGTFGNLYQINANFNEILISAATVSDIEIISSITLTQLTQR